MSKKIDLTNNFDYQLINKDGLAVSPLADYPGTVKMPMFSLSVFKRWRESLAANVSNEAAKQNIVFYFDSGQDDSTELEIGQTEVQAEVQTEGEPVESAESKTAAANGLRFVDVNRALVVIDIAEIKIDGLGDNWRDDPLSTVHYTLLVWFAMIEQEWENRQITFRRSKP